MKIEQLDFEHAYIRRTGPETSAAAGQGAKAVSGKTRIRVYEYIASKGTYGATDAEIEVALDMTRTRTNRPRRKELVDNGWVVDSGKQRDGGIVWITT